MIHGNVIVAAQMYQKEREVVIVLYCEMPDGKKGFKYVASEFEAGAAFWQALGFVLKPIYQLYANTKMIYAFSKLFLELPGGSARQAVTPYLHSFSHIEHQSNEDYLEELDLVYKEITNQTLVKNKLYSLNMQAFKEMASVHRKQHNQHNQLKDRIQQLESPEVYENIEMPREGIVLDLETTGFAVKFARIIEISALRFRDGLVVDSYNTLINPGIRIPKAVAALTGITQDKVKDAKQGYDAIKELLSFMKNSSVMVGHNIGFDYAILQEHCKKFRLPMWQGRILCTHKLAKASLLNVKSYSLEDLCVYFDIHNVQPHRAWSDTAANFALMQSLYKESLLL
ncbi:PolC-type DNA polymerase III [Paenibacillus solisilvae]|uniref:PolC-type DNA polymerase III n=1 Tax=Paenibacillus solisilvae TaxID=2486751 RepID=A0ABW0W3S6_9BACL